jgi:hypothetical protein
LNVLLFYVWSFRHIAALGPDEHPPVQGRISGALSLVLWLVVIVCGRLITFFRPTGCDAGEAVGFLADCIVR